MPVFYPIPLYLAVGPLRRVRGTVVQVQEYVALLDYGVLADRFDVLIERDRTATAWCADTMRPAIRAMRQRMVQVRYGQAHKELPR